jgi:riboflavin synthase
MFSGLVEGLAEVLALARERSGARLVLAAPALERGAPRWKPVRGESIAVGGCCLTVTAALARGRTAYDLSRETLGLTWFSALNVGERVNVERSVRLADRLGGHLVAGHVDALGRVVRSADSDDGGRLVTFEVPRGFERWLLPKGSITIDGVSLTIVAARARRVQVGVVPETQRKTSHGTAGEGTPVHLEADLIGKWIAQLVAPVVRTPRRARS